MHARPRLQSYQLFDNGLTYIPFYESKDVNDIFSNFYRRPLTADGQVFATPEHYFQALKISVLLLDPGLPTAVRTHPSLNQALLEINQSATPEEARLAANRCTDQLKRLFDFQTYWAQKKQEILLQVIRQRYWQDPDFAGALSGTGNMYIVEDTFKAPGGRNTRPDIYNGAGSDGMGLNNLGFALMQVREEAKLKRSLTAEELEAFRIDTESMRDIARLERQRLDAEAARRGERTHGRKFQELVAMSRRFYAGAAPHAPVHTGRRHPPHAAGFKPAPADEHVPAATIAASKEISQKINANLGHAAAPADAHEKSPIIRPGRMKDRNTFKLAFDNPADAQALYDFLKSHNYPATYYGNKPENPEKYPIRSGGKIHEHIVRVEDIAAALAFLQNTFRDAAKGQDLLNNIQLARGAASLSGPAPAASRRPASRPL